MSEEYLQNWQVFPGFELKLVANGFDLPVNLAFVPNISENPKDPFFM